MKKMNENQLQNLEAGKFWGTSCSEINFPNGQCVAVCQYQIFWQVVSEWEESC